MLTGLLEWYVSYDTSTSQTKVYNQSLFYFHQWMLYIFA